MARQRSSASMWRLRGYLRPYLGRFSVMFVKASIGIGATIVPSVTLGCEAIIGAGSVVLEDVPSLATMVGVPARPIRLAGASEDEVAMLLPAQSL